MNRWRWWIIGWITALAALLATPAAAAVPGTVLRVCVLPARPAMTAPALFARPAAFACDVNQRSLGSGDYWVLSEPLPFIADPPRYSIRVPSLWRSNLTMYVLHADGAIARAGFGGRATHRWLRIGGVVDMPLPRGAAPPVQILWHVRGAANIHAILEHPVLVDRLDASRGDIAVTALYAAFLGLAFGLLVYNLALWAALRRAFQPAYCLLLICLIGYALTSSGLIMPFFPAMDGNDRIRLNGLMLGAVGASVLLFAQFFFGPRVFDRRLKTINIAAMAALLGSVILFALAAPWHMRMLDGLVTSSFALMMVLMPWVLIQAWRRRSNYLWVFAVAWGVPIAVSSVRLAAALNLVPWAGWIEHSTIAAMALEALLSSIGIAYRIRLVGRERDEAREQEMVARTLADIDGLTGLLNRRAFLRQAIGRAGPQTLLIADLDHFKRINETIGHDGGDEVLRAVARVLTGAAPPGALIARMGGEEFAVLTDAGTGIASAGILAGLREARMPYDLAVTASIGTCTGPLSHETDWKTLYREADRALYAAKAAGRDCARDASPPGGA